MLKSLLIKSIKIYQAASSRFFRSSCRFYPTCSEYMLVSLEKYGLIAGLWKGTKRIFRCHPWSPGGVDEP